MYPSSESVALLLALLLKRAEKTRARISDKTLRSVSGRVTIRDAFIADVRSWLEEVGVMMVRLERGGYALVAISALEGAPPILGKDHIGTERQELSKGTLKLSAIWEELGFLNDSDEE